MSKGLLLLLLLAGAAGCGVGDHAGKPGAGPALVFTLADDSAGEGNPCLALADGVTIDVVPGPEFGPFWRNPESGALSLPALSIPIGETGSAIVDIHVLGYIAEAPPPRGLPISKGGLSGLELRSSGTSGVVIRMACADNDGDGLLDIEEDCNLNGRLDTDIPTCGGGTLFETDPALADTDGGGIPDGDEREHLTDPLDPDDDLVLYGMYPRVVYPGDNVTISGRGFSRSLYDNVVRFGGITAQNLSVDQNLRYLTVRVPEGASAAKADLERETPVPFGAGKDAGLLQPDSLRPPATPAPASGDPRPPTAEARGHARKDLNAGAPYLHAAEVFLPVTVEVAGLESAPLYCLPGGTALAVIPVGDHPNNLLFSPDGSRAYVVNQDSQDLSVVDVEGLAELTGPGKAARIPLGEDPISLDITRDGATLYVVNRLSEDVTPVDCLGPAAAGDNIPVGPEPWDIVMLPDRPRAYVVNYGAHVYGVVSILDTASHSHVVDIDFPPDILTSARGVEIGLTPDGTRAWLVHDPEHHIYKIDTATDQVRWGETVLNSCTEGRKLAFSPDGNFAYLVGPGNTAGGWTLLAEVPVRDSFVWLDDSECFPVHVPALAIDLVMRPQGDRIFIGTHFRVCEGLACNIGEVFAVDLGGRQGASVLTTYSVTDLAVSPDGSRLYAADVVQDVVQVLDTASDTVVAVASVPGNMDRPAPGSDGRPAWRELHRRRMALSPDGARLVTVNTLTDDVALLAAGDPLPFRLATIPQTAALESPAGNCCDPTLAAFSPDGSRAYSTADQTHNLNLIDTRTHRVIQTVDLRGFIGDRGEADCPRISQLAVSPDGASVYCWITKNMGCLGAWEDLLARVDTDTGAIAAALWTGFSSWPSDLVVPHPAAGKLYFLNIHTGEVWVLDPLTLERIATVPVNARSLLFNPFDTGRAYLVEEHGVVFLDPRTDTLLDADNDPATTGKGLPPGISRIEVGPEDWLQKPRLSPDVKRLYALDGQLFYTSDEILVVDLVTGVPARSFKPRGRPRDLMPCPAGRKLYVIVGGAPEVQIYDTRTFQLVGRVPVGNDTLSLTPTPDGRQILVATKTTLYGVDVVSDQVVASLPVCGRYETIETVAVSPDGSLAYVTYNPRPTTEPDRTQAGIQVVRLPAPLALDGP